MHEMALAEGIVEIVEKTARRHKAQTVRAVCLEIGALAQVEQEALRFSFDVIVKNTIAHGARLDVVTTPGRAWCMPCSETVELHQLGAACPRCGSHQLQVTQGGEMRVREIEIA